MKPSDLLVAHLSPNKKVINVMVKGRAYAKILGSSLPISADRHGCVNSFSIQADGGGVIEKRVIVSVQTNPMPDGAIVIRLSGKDQGPDQIMFLRIYWQEVSEKNFEPRIDLENTFPMPSGKLAQAYQSDDTVEITVNGQLVTTANNKENSFYVRDADPICEYLVGSLTAEQLLAQTTKNQKRK